MSIIIDQALADSLHLPRFTHALVKRLLAIEQINELNRACAALSGREFAGEMLRALDVRLIVKEDAFSALSPGRPMVVVSNHPFGLLDGLILIKLLGERVDRFKLITNYLLADIESLHQHFVFVNSLDDGGDRRSNTANVRAVLRLAREQNSIVTFPAGDVSSLRPFRWRVEDRDWDPASVKLIRKLNLPILPVYIEGRNSILYQVMNALNHRLGLIRLPRELLNKRSRSVRIVTGDPLRLTAADQFGDITSLSKRLRGAVDRLRGV